LFASQFHHLFPESEGDNAIEMKEVPVPMMALAGTGVSLSNFNKSCGALAPLLECRTGEHQAMEFTANMFTGVYNGHVSNFKLIKEKNVMASHSMMMDIYAQARYVW
jgi:hypothetical protein